MTYLRALSLLFLIIVAMTAPALAAQNWPQWRGPANNGISPEKNIATSWSKDENVRWRLELPGPAPSTPAIWGDRIFLSAAIGKDLKLLAVDTGGKIIWERALGGGNRVFRQGESNSASPSPSTDGKHVWIFVQTGVLACFDIEGKEIWRVNLQEKYGKFSTYHGMSTSPLLDSGRLYVQLLHSNAQLVVALDAATGSEIWKHSRETDAKTESLHSYASPLMYEGAEGPVLLVHGSDYITAHEPDTGKELWRSGGLQAPGGYNHYFRFVATPAAGNGLIVAPSAKGGPVLGIRPAGASGDISAQLSQYHWKIPNGSTDVPSPLIHDGIVYMCRQNGVLVAFDAKTGKEIYEQSVYRRRHRASPVLADGKLYLAAADGTVNVVRTGRKYELLATNKIDEYLAASPAIANGVLYLRTFDALYAIAE